MSFKSLIADDHPLFRVALRQAVSACFDGDIAESADLEQTLEQLKLDEAIELVFLDVNMPGNDGLYGLSQIRLKYPDVLVVMVSAIEQPVMIQKALQLGAVGFIPKSSSLDVIQHAIDTILDGQSWVPEHLHSQFDPVADSEQSDFAKNIEQLTPQQLVVLKMMADGLLNKQIAYELGIKETTIKQHGSAILKKLSLNNRTQAGVLFKQLMNQ